MEVTFYNVTVTIVGATDAKDAYTRLCAALATTDCEWLSDTYAMPDLANGDRMIEGETSELFPEGG